LLFCAGLADAFSADADSDEGMMALNATQILETLVSTRQILRERFGVARIGLFGAFARGEHTPDGDIDLLVVFNEPTFDNYMDLKFYLEEIFARPVNLVPADAVKPRLRPIIEQEIIYA
jgi:predicted nucleotidyltransferase